MIITELVCEFSYTVLCYHASFPGMKNAVMFYIIVMWIRPAFAGSYLRSGRIRIQTGYRYIGSGRIRTQCTPTENNSTLPARAVTTQFNYKTWPPPGWTSYNRHWRDQTYPPARWDCSWHTGTMWQNAISQQQTTNWHL